MLKAAPWIFMFFIVFICVPYFWVIVLAFIGGLIFAIIFMSVGMALEVTFDEWERKICDKIKQKFNKK